ncbi:protein NO VEIN domain-containing protein, partial [Chryseobacterium sp. SIMBA_029]|uniref:protein NO VEIN domain-containing protein n=1 Tax=Chryseobacterium sp. SIMBA_029 TaxID=3085772 RepID=UPI00397B15FE
MRLYSLGCANPVDHIVRVSESDVGAGYDMRSMFEGETRYIEVKSSSYLSDA